ncbi:hypothetical protein EKO04_006574 [Ascochyta lentis]|uniref:Uncharacterized protein n=1 Tax=Ascochyta lentis TaxID=205686 RepID=A0A8H7MI92_9PLEO|nr:hypothetical protein EKO04_006574 [Ascochyta lentis]
MRAMAMNTTVSALAAAGTILSDSRIGCGWPRESPAEVSSVTRCSTKFAASSPPWGPTTDYFTSTSYAYRSKTELLTPKPSTTSVSATSTFTEYETAPNNLTKTVWTDTYTWTNYYTKTETVSSTFTVTTSVLQTATVPTRAGFTPVAAAYPEATQHVDDVEDQDQWTVEDAYWQDDFVSQQDPEVPDAVESGVASKVQCLITLINIYDSGTTSSRLYVPPPTYTRTNYVTTETITSTVTTRVSPTETPYTFSMASGLESRSWFTETRTNVETTTTTDYPSSTTSVYAACATDNVVDTYKGWPLNSLADDWYSKNLTIIRLDWSDNTNATACCATAAANPNAIFFKYDGVCEVFVDDRTETGYNASAKIDVSVLYEPRERGWWGMTVGNGPRGSVSFSSLWV